GGRSVTSRAASFLASVRSRRDKSTPSLAKPPCFTELRRERSLPRAVRGPVDFFELCRLAASFFGEIGRPVAFFAVFRLTIRFRGPDAAGWGVGTRSVLINSKAPSC